MRSTCAPVAAAAARIASSALAWPPSSLRPVRRGANCVLSGGTTGARLPSRRCRHVVVAVVVDVGLEPTCGATLLHGLHPDRTRRRKLDAHGLADQALDLRHRIGIVEVGLRRLGRRGAGLATSGWLGGGFDVEADAGEIAKRSVSGGARGDADRLERNRLAAAGAASGADLATWPASAAAVLRLSPCVRPSARPEPARSRCWRAAARLVCRSSDIASSASDQIGDRVAGRRFVVGRGGDAEAGGLRPKPKSKLKSLLAGASAPAAARRSGGPVRRRLAHRRAPDPARTSDSRSRA